MTRFKPVLILLAVTALIVGTASAEKAKVVPAPKSGATPAEAASKEEKSTLLSLPIPIGEEVKVIKIPYFDLDGKLRMQFFAEVAVRLAAESVEFRKLFVQFFTVEGKEELSLSLPASELDLRSQILSSKEGVNISRPDLMIAGVGMKFDTKARRGTIQGPVRMIIFDRKELQGN